MNSERISSIKAVFFDFDDTLVETRARKWEQHKLIAQTYYGITLTDDDIRVHYGKPMDDLIMLLYKTDDYEKALEYVNRHRADFPKVIYEGTIPTLNQLRVVGKLTGVVTATSRESIKFDPKLESLITEHIDYLQTHDDTKFHKPHPKVFDPAINWLLARDLKPNQAVYVGDSLHDREAAFNAGFHFIGVTTGLVSAEEFESHGAISVSSVEKITSHI